MRFNRARYITLCQQSLVTAAVLAVGISAAGVKTLDIVPAPGPVDGAQGAQGGAAPEPDVLPATTSGPASSEVASGPVTPKVREVAVTSRSAAAPSHRRPVSSSARAARPAAPETVDGRPVVALSSPQKVTGYGTVGVTWKPGVRYTEKQVGVQVRTEDKGRWSSWQTVQYHDDHGPDSDPGELTAHARPGTDALVIGDVDRVQMRAETSSGQAIPDLQLAVIDPGTGKMVKQKPAAGGALAQADGAGSTGSSASAALSSQEVPAAAEPAAAPSPAPGASESGDSATLAAMKVAPQPKIYTRAQWGANEKLRESGPPDYGTIKTGFVHHTVNANNYTAAQVPALLRGIYAYHTQSRGWRDIGYNFLVDRFGRIWEGRYGGITKAVVGAHTLGYNEVSFAMSAIGNYDIAQPPQAVLTAYAKLFAWKLSMYNIHADATHLYVKNRYLNAINGHRDVGQTACPGRYLYAKIPYIRSLARKYQDAAQSGTTAKPSPTPTPTPTPSSTFSKPTQLPLTWTKQSTTISYPHSSNIAGSVYPDLVLKGSSGAISVLPTGGQLGFSAPVSNTGEWSLMNLVAAVGDVTGDGKSDVLARVSKDGYTRVYTGDGAGHVNHSGIQATQVFRPATALMAAGDWNGDHKNDVLMKDVHGKLWLVPGLGSGRFGTPKLLSSAWTNMTSTAVVGDLDADGHPDLISLDRNGWMYRTRSKAGAILSTPVKVQAVDSSYDTVVGGAADATGDSIGDVILSNSKTGAIAIKGGVGKDALGQAVGWFPVAKGLTGLSAAQMSGNGQVDLVGRSTDHKTLVVVPNKGLSNLRPVRASKISVPDATQVLAVGDWNRDGKSDIVARQKGGDVLALYRGRGDGTFGGAMTMSKGWKTVRGLAAVGDVTGDKNPDIAGRTSAGKMIIWPGNGKLGFLAPRTAPATMSTYNKIGTAAWSPATANRVFTSSDGSFVPSAFAVATLTGYNWVVGPGDVDGDGRADLIARDAAGRLWLLPGGGSALGTRRLIGTGFGGYQLAG